MIRSLIIGAALAAVPHIATAQTYIRATAGAAVNAPTTRDFARNVDVPNRNPFTSRIITDADAPTIEAAVGHDLGTFRLEANIGGSAWAAGNAGCSEGCKGGNPGPNQRGPYDPDKQKGYVWGASVTVNALYDQPVTDKLTLSAGGGVGAAYYKPDTGFSYKGGWRQTHATLGVMWKAIGEARYRVGNHTEATLRVTHEDIGNRRVNFAAESGRVLSSVSNPVRYQTVTAGITYSFGGAK